MSGISRSDYGMRDLSQTVITSAAQHVQHTPWEKASANEQESGNVRGITGSAHREKLQQEVERLNESMKDMGRSLRFKYNEKTQEYYVEVLDLKSQEVIETLPPKYLMDLSATVKEIVGMYVDKKI